MIYEPSTIAVVIFLFFVGVTLGLSFYLGRNAKSSSGYFAAHGEIPWFVNGIAFAGDYLSAASFLGICGMIAFYGYDGFLYSIGYLAGWIVALFVIAEPMKRLGKFTFADALNSKFQSRGIQFAAGVSTLAVSLFYLIPQMVGAGSLVQPLLGFNHSIGVILVGTVVILIVVTAGMVSTTWVQFLKGSLLVVFTAILTVLILQRGFTEQSGGADGYKFLKLQVASGETFADAAARVDSQPVEIPAAWAEKGYVSLKNSSGEFKLLKLLPDVGATDTETPAQTYMECQTIVTNQQGTFYNGILRGDGATHESPAQLHPVGFISDLAGENSETGPVGPIEFFKTIQNSTIILWGKEILSDAEGAKTTIFYPKPTSGSRVLRPGESPSFSGIRQSKIWPKLNFLSLMLALFCGTASLPHILIRYYTVKDTAAARKSTIVGIASIGFFYVLTLFLGLGAMTSGAIDVTDSNMAAPLLAKSMNEWLFAMISAIAFTTVLGTVSGLILASAGAVSHDLMKGVLGIQMTDHQQVRIAKISSVFVGILAIMLGILFKDMNVTYLVGWAFSVAASANLPALIMLLFWKGTTKQGIIAAVLVGMFASLTWILLSAETFTQVYGMVRPAWLDNVIPFSQPGIVTIPLSFLTLWGVSRATKESSSASKEFA